MLYCSVILVVIRNVSGPIMPQQSKSKNYGRRCQAFKYPYFGGVRPVLNVSMDVASTAFWGRQFQSLMILWVKKCFRTSTCTHVENKTSVGQNTLASKHPQNKTLFLWLFLLCSLEKASLCLFPTKWELKVIKQNVSLYLPVVYRGVVTLLQNLYIYIDNGCVH